MIRPVCAQCTRDVRTVDTPGIKVRVERAVVFRRGEDLVLSLRCHGVNEQIAIMVGPHTGSDRLDEKGLDEWLDRLEVFRGE